jgi:hypothetical protein
LISAQFGKFRQYDHEQSTGITEPGFGQFYLVATKPGWAGGVSCELLNLDDEDLEHYLHAQDIDCQPPEEVDEWLSKCIPYVLGDKSDGKPLEIVLKRGLKVDGQIVDTNGKPVAKKEVTLFLDLHAGTHTGHGNEIFEQQSSTNREGKFQFESVYPNDFYLELLNHSGGPPYWIRTRVRNRWVDKIEDEIAPRQDEWDPNKYEKFIRLLIIASSKPLYRYFGQVADEDGHPVAWAKVQIRNSLHEPERTFEDDHDYWWHTHTDSHGNYSLRVGARFVNAIWVTAGNKSGNDDSEEGELMAPGRYDITVRPAKRAGR